jgi:hypothetical protein
MVTAACSKSLLSTARMRRKSACEYGSGSGVFAFGTFTLRLTGFVSSRPSSVAQR